MANSLSLSTYIARSRKTQRRAQVFDQLRPAGFVIWLHCADAERATALADLGQRLAHQINAKLLLTVPYSCDLPARLEGIAICAHAPSEHPEDIRQFLNHWSPDCAIWMGQSLRIGLIHQAHARRVPMFLVDADTPELEIWAPRWLPSPKRVILQMFTQIFAREQVAAQQISRLIKHSIPVTLTGPLLAENPVLPCNNDDLTSLSETLVARPCWLAAHAQLDELPIILDAQHSISRLSPRMLLILVPDTAKNAAEIHRHCRDRDFHVALWDDGDFPTEKTDILLAENPRELGLFFRIAPISLMASSLKPGHGGRDPFDPAALGSAVLYGPNVTQHLSAYGRLAAAEAAKLVETAPALVRALEELMAPDKVATMVHAGWDTVSQGAGVINQIVTEIGATLDRSEDIS